VVVEKFQFEVFSIHVYSSAMESISTSGHSHMSADSIAISLLKRFSENQLPKASELVWMVSAEDAPQEVNLNFILGELSF